MVDCLLCKCENLSLNPRPTKNKKTTNEQISKMSEDQNQESCIWQSCDSKVKKNLSIPNEQKLRDFSPLALPLVKC
jgi:hypothetical protein